jgi:hypothetical protein
MPDALEIVARFTADTADLVAGSEKAKGALGGISVESLAMGGAVVAGAGVAIAAIAGMTQAAAEDRDEQAKLEQAITAAGAATATSTDQVNAAIAASQARAFTDSETRDALQSLVTATGDVTSATALLSTAQDVARFAGVDLATASDAVAKAQAGNAGALAKLIPGLDKGTSATETLANAQKLAAGQAELFASSTEGQMQIANDSFSELGETVGSAFLPILDELVPAIIPIIQLLGELVTAVMPPLIAIIKIAVEAIKIIIGVLKQWLDFVFSVYGAIGQKLTPVLNALGPVLDGVGKAIGGVVDWIQSLLKWIGDAIGAVGRFLDSLNPLKGISLPNISLPFSAPAPAAVAATRGARSTRQAGVTTVTINTSADPEAVIRALKRWAGNNGGSGTFLRGLDRAAS